MGQAAAHLLVFLDVSGVNGEGRVEEQEDDGSRPWIATPLGGKERFAGRRGVVDPTTVIRWEATVEAIGPRLVVRRDPQAVGSWTPGPRGGGHASPTMKEIRMAGTTPRQKARPKNPMIAWKVSMISL
jgi:hypothetical protein